MNVPAKARQSSFLLTFLLLLTALVGTGASVGVAAGDGDDEPKHIVVSVTDNSPDARLNARTIFEAVAHPDENPELYEFLGRPTGVAPVFGMNPALEDAKPEYLALLESMGHYVKLGYPSQAEVEGIVERVRADDRFSYAQVETAPGFSATPNDPLFPNTQPWLPDNENYQWASQSNALNLPAAWDRIKGWATVGVLEAGIANAPDPGGWRSYVIDHPDLQRVVSYNMSFNYETGYPPGGAPPTGGSRQLWNAQPGSPNYIAPFAHGTHVVGLIAANANNGIGVAGECWYCSIAFSQVGNYIDTALAYQTYWGAQVINFSGFVRRSVSSCGWYSGSSVDPHCLAIGLTMNHDIVYVAASGNNLNTFIEDGNFPGSVDFPAHDPQVIAIGGSDVRSNMWDEHYPGSGSWLYPISGDFTTAPNTGCPEFWNGFSMLIPPYQCGSNTGSPGGNEQDFIAPARRIVSTVPAGTTYQPTFPDICNDYNFGAANDGYGVCTGTSMAAPLVSGIAALVRSANPLLQRSHVYDALKKSASQLGVYSQSRGWGIPNAGFAVSLTFGKVGGVIVRNRLTPMFALKNDVDEDRLYTTRPQVAIGALSGVYLAEALYAGPGYCDPIICTSSSTVPAQNPRPYFSASVAEGHSPVNGFEDYLVYKPVESKEPRSAFWVFTSEKKVWKEVAMRPLYRLSFAEECDWRDHIYTTELINVDALTTTDWCPSQSGNQPYQYDAIEGYILASCPPGYNCQNPLDGTAPQKLFRRYSYVEHSNALLTQAQLALSAFASYYSDPWGGADGFLGFVFPNVDSDGDTLPDGLERMFGMNWSSIHSDCDGISDGIEYPMLTLQPSNYDPLIGGCF